MSQYISKKLAITTLIIILLILAAIVIWASLPHRLSTKLGYPSDAKLLIIHADDFGVCHSVNAATIKALETGVVTSASVMVPCPFFEEAAAYSRENPDADVGVHLTFTNEYGDYNWGPVSPVADVPSLVNSQGHFYSTTQEVWQYGTPEHLEREMRAQIEKALAAGIRPTHVDSHMGVVFAPKFVRIYLRVASEYHLPAMVPRQYIYLGESWGLKIPSKILHKLLALVLDARGYLMIDRLYIGGLDEVTIPQDEYYRWVMDNLTTGVNEVIVHVALDSGDVGVLGNRRDRRIKDFEIMTDPATRKLIESKRVVLVGYRPMQQLPNER